VPTPHGLIWVRVETGKLQIDSLVPVIVELSGKAVQHLPAGKYSIGSMSQLV
jgi:hypothetical protein